jgi:hypothetical protein
LKPLTAAAFDGESLDEWNNLLCVPCGTSNATCCPSGAPTAFCKPPGDPTATPCGHTPCETTCNDAPSSLDWNDFDRHVGDWKVCFSRLIPSFGPVGLLTGLLSETEPLDDPWEAFLDTCASMTVTPFRHDFIDYEEVQGKVLKGLTQGATI